MNGRLPPVNRRLLTILLPLVAATLAAGCTTFSDNDAAARVGDQELSDEMLGELVGLVPDPQTGVAGETTDGNAVRNALTFWIQSNVLADLIGAQGIEVDDTVVDQATQQASTQLTGFAELSSDSQEFIVGYFASTALVPELALPSEEDRAAFYEQGPVGSGITCVSHILLATEEEAIEVGEALDDGADFPTLAQERSTDEASGPLGGVLPCSFTTSFETSYAPSFVDASLVAEIGVPTEPVESEFGFHVVRVRTYDEVADELGTYFDSSDFAVATVIGDADIFVNPRYGALDDRGVVVPLG